MPSIADQRMKRFTCVRAHMEDRIRRSIAVRWYLPEAGDGTVLMGPGQGATHDRDSGERVGLFELLRDVNGSGTGAPGGTGQFQSVDAHRLMELHAAVEVRTRSASTGHAPDLSLAR